MSKHITPEYSAGSCFLIHVMAFNEATILERTFRRQTLADIAKEVLDGQIFFTILAIYEVDFCEGWTRNRTEDVAMEMRDQIINRRLDVSDPVAIELLEQFRIHWEREEENPRREHGTYDATSIYGGRAA